MKKHLHIFGILALAMVFSISACNKDDDENNDAKTNADYLTSGTWRITAMNIDPPLDMGGGIIIDDFFNFMDNCTKDDLVTFNTNGTITDDEGPTKCDPDDPQTTNDGTWTLTENTKLTIMYPDEDDVEINITEINDTTLKGTMTITEDFGAGPIPMTIKVTMVKA